MLKYTNKNCSEHVKFENAMKVEYGDLENGQMPGNVRVWHDGGSGGELMLRSEGGESGSTSRVDGSTSRVHAPQPATPAQRTHIAHDR